MNQSLIKIENGVPMTTSVAVAKKFEKPHRLVLDAVRKVLTVVPEDWGRANFRASSYQNQQNKTQPCYLMSFDGFSMTALGFTGDKALRYRFDYVCEFRRMVNQIEANRQLAASEQALLDSGEGDLIRRSMLISHAVLHLHTLGLLPEMTTSRMTAMVRRGELEGEYVPRKSRVYRDSIRSYMVKLGIIPKGIFEDGH